MVTAGIDVRLATQADAADWDAFAEARPEASGYHLWGWREIVERAFAHETMYLLARAQERVAGILPLVVFRTALFGRFAVSLPFVNYGGVIAGNAEVARALLQCAHAVARHRRLSHIELRHQQAQFPELPSKQHKVAMWLDLPSDPECAWDGFDRKVRNQVRKAEKSGLVIESGDEELLPDFYSVFARNMRDLGTPVYDRRFFAEVLRQFPAATRVFVVRHDTAPVAAAISYRYRDTTEVPWASSLKEYLPSCPNNLLYWGIIQHAIASGSTRLDFGRSTPHEGTYRFKEQWGATPQPLCWEYRLVRGRRVPDQSPKNPHFKTAIAIWKRLPLGLTTWIGPRVVRTIP